MPAGHLKAEGAVAYTNEPFAVLHAEADEVVSANQLLADGREQIMCHRLIDLVLEPADCAAVFRRSHNALKRDDRSRAAG